MSSSGTKHVFYTKTTEQNVVNSPPPNLSPLLVCSLICLVFSVVLCMALYLVLFYVWCFFVLFYVWCCVCLLLSIFVCWWCCWYCFVVCVFCLLLRGDSSVAMLVDACAWESCWWCAVVHIHWDQSLHVLSFHTHTFDAFDSTSSAKLSNRDR